MREVVIRVVCDHCRIEGSEDEILNVLITIPAGQYELDLCDSCGNAVLQGCRPAPKKTTGAPEVNALYCLHDGCGKTFKTQRGLSKHQQSVGHK